MGLLLLRVAAGGAVLAQGLAGSPSDLSLGPLSRMVIAGAGAAFLIAGLWTPVAACTVAMCSLWGALSHFGEPGTNFLLSSIGAALALLGPGAWSVDAKLFGWKRIDVDTREG